MTDPYRYVGQELDLVSRATVWKTYLGSMMAPYLQGEVLEVGAGMGQTTLHLCDCTQTKWTCLEPDEVLANICRAQLKEFCRGSVIEIVTGTVDDLPAGQRFDSIVYADVLEHMEEDRGELLRASQRLRQGGGIDCSGPGSSMALLHIRCSHRAFQALQQKDSERDCRAWYVASTNGLSGFFRYARINL